MARAARALGGRTAEARAGGAPPRSDPACEPGADGGVSGRQPGRASGLRRGALRGLCGPGQGGRAGRAEAPGGAAGVPGEPALVSQLPPGPRRRAGVEAGAGRGARGGGRAAGGGGSHSEFPATVPASRKGTAARRGQDARRERLASRLQPAAGTERAARGRAGLRQGAPRARRPGGPREAPPPPRVPRRRVLGRRERASERVQTSTHARAGESPNGRCSHTCKPAEGSPGRDPAEGSGSPGVARPEEDEGGSLRRGRGDRVLVFPRTAFILISLLFRCSRCSDSYQGPSGHPSPCPGPPCARGAYARQRECSANVRY